MKYDDINNCKNGVPAIPKDLVLEIERLSGIKDLSFVLAVGASQDGEGDRLVALVPEGSVDDVSEAKFPIDTTQLLDVASITLVKYEGCHWNTGHWNIPCGWR